MLVHYGAVADPARVCDPNRKGTVENAIQHTQNTALKGRKFETIEEQNAYLLDWEERWASQRIHGRVKRQVAVMFEEEKPQLKPLPIRSFKYFREEIRTVADDGLIQVGQQYYAARPAMPHSRVMVRIYDFEIEVYDPVRLTMLRRHRIGPRSGSVSMDESDRIFNPSRETAYLLRQAERIGPCTHTLCEGWFRDEGRRGQKWMRGVLALAKRHDSATIEKACQMAINKGLRSSKLVGRLADTIQQAQVTPEPELTQTHELIRDLSQYTLFFNDNAATDCGSTLIH